MGGFTRTQSNDEFNENRFPTQPDIQFSPRQTKGFDIDLREEYSNHLDLVSRLNTFRALKPNWD
jgi:hypothetical protein